MSKKREVSESYLNMFIEDIKAGYPVILVKASNILAVDHPTRGYTVLKLADKVVPDEE